MTTIVFPEKTLDKLRASLIATSPIESAAILLAGPARIADRLLVHEMLLVPPDAYMRRDRNGLTIAPTFLAYAMKRARRAQDSLILVHSHPGSTAPQFSLVDDECERILMPVFNSRVPNRTHATIVIGSAGEAGRAYHGGTQQQAHIRSVGSVITDHNLPSNDEMLPESVERNVRAFGVAGQRRLNELHVGIVGLGGTGSLMAQQLAHLGVKQFTLVDHDTIEETNLNRVVGTTVSDVGIPKVSVAQRMITCINPRAKTNAVHGNVVREIEGTQLLGCDVIFSCTDSHGSRAILNHLSYAYYIPVIDMGVVVSAEDATVHEITGRVQMLAPGLSCLVCHNLLDAEEVRQDLLTAEERKRDPYVVGARIPQPAVISFNSTVTSLATTMFLGATVGMPMSARHQIYRGIPGIVRAITSQPLETCIVCSSAGVRGQGDNAPPPWRRI